MSNDNVSNMLLIVIVFTFNGITTHSLSISYNQPKLCPNATWNPSPIDIIKYNGGNHRVNSLFISTNNTIYVSEQKDERIDVWLTTNSYNLKTSLITYSDEPYALFINDMNDIFVDLNNPFRIEKKTISPSSTTIVMNNTGRCAGLFIDINNTLYCSITDKHRVLAKSLNNMTSTVATVAGTGSFGSSSNMLYGPCGIFVTITFRLYVSECGNDRIQFFEVGSPNGTIIAEQGLSSGVTLDCPTGIILDADEHLYIVDTNGYRVVQFKFDRFSVVGRYSSVTSSFGNTMPQAPETLSFDSHGNIYIADRQIQDRVLKFILTTNSCDELTTTQLPQTTSTSNIIISTATKLTSIAPTTSDEVTTPSSLSFIAPICSNYTMIGIHCNISSTPCDVPNLCQNNSTCENTNTTYICHCSPGFNGTQCQYDHRPCPPNRCWNNGICNVLNNTTFNCTCAMNWTGLYCETMINYCDENVTCENEGVCRSLLGDYQCECLGESYSGRHCEIKSTALITHQVVSKSFASIAIVGISSIIIFIITMDIMKYCFGIDPVRGELERIRRKKRRYEKPKPPIIQRFLYKDTPSLSNP
ncbi:hypothetical protein I4U23_005845 [Adineta vaga]|nr:hypothetical protein I4U23_005845 [Adineta vaga]